MYSAQPAESVMEALAQHKEAIDGQPCDKDIDSQPCDKAIDSQPCGKAIDSQPCDVYLWSERLETEPYEMSSSISPDGQLPSRTGPYHQLKSQWEPVEYGQVASHIPCVMNISSQCARACVCVCVCEHVHCSMRGKCNSIYRTMPHT